MAEKLNVEKREEFGKGAARRIRTENKIPAVLYGHGTDPVHLVLPGHETALAARNANALLDLTLPDGESHLGLIKEIQRHPLSRNITHLDLILVRRGEKVEVDIPVYVTGEPVSPAIAVVDAQSLTLSVDALAVPESIEISVEEQEEGYQLFAGDVVLPQGTELITDPELLVVAVQLPRVEEEPEEETEGEETAEGEESSEDAEESSEESEKEE
ncbi:50S ribosomal protein L25/general stress protein Ctc [Brachybacterium halotolerans subsp. kimchii]|uniref:50S ribosomal protein L25/general stress protein Ctc n=1 Tax=Brachybacterium TaxID=43668 RepID=UPI001E62014F|nr:MULTISPECIES: 50S ribosomal protein L25/general stress protein Ctc [Brachybacterium]MCG7309285.1 50S ribosomal protein L25/general stress protein Ctc [Brachybacterium sp. ACRRE]UEJ83428.1 50S ribosomal protein L25/general stress protein Ctc [Brachybacterium halotolerans subsp. kimchii]